MISLRNISRHRLMLLVAILSLLLAFSFVTGGPSPSYPEGSFLNLVCFLALLLPLLFVLGGSLAAMLRDSESLSPTSPQLPQGPTGLPPDANVPKEKE